jgi:hypothetical protein
MTAESVPPLELPPVWVVSKVMAHDHLREVYEHAAAGGWVLIRDDRGYGGHGGEFWVSCQPPPWWEDDSEAHRRALADRHRLRAAWLRAAKRRAPDDGQAHD